MDIDASERRWNEVGIVFLLLKGAGAGNEVER